MQGWLNFQKVINVTILTIKKEKYLMIILVNKEKSCHKIQYLFIIKEKNTSQQTRNRKEIP